MIIANWRSTLVLYKNKLLILQFRVKKNKISEFGNFEDGKRIMGKKPLPFCLNY